MSDPFVSAVCRGLAALTPPPRILLAVSGGADSIALLDAIVRGGKREDLAATTFVVGHFDHALREESSHDAALVEGAATQRNLSFLLRRRTEALPRGLSMEHGAREARYAALVEMAREAACEAIVTAHTATDQAETLLWRIARGAGTRGLGGIRAVRELGGLRLLRPMLEITREETRAYCARRQVPFVDDPTNTNELPRARIRAEVLPVLERLFPRSVERIAATAMRLHEDNELLESLAEPLLAGPPEALLLSLRGAPRPLRMRALARWFGDAGGDRTRLASSHIEALERLVLTGRGEVELPATAERRQVATILHKALLLEARPRVKQQAVESDARQPQIPAFEEE